MMVRAFGQRVLAIITFTFSMFLLACSPAEMASNSAAEPVTVTDSNVTSPYNTPTKRLAVVLEWEDLQTQDIVAPQNGHISQMLVQDGQYVQAGQRLLQIEPAQQLSVKSVTTPHIDHAAKQQAYEKWQQDKALYAQGFVSAAAVAKSEAAYQSASKSQVVVNPVAQSPQNLPPTWLEAPFSGVIRPLAISHGNYIKNGQKLFILEPSDTQRLKIMLAQENFQALFVGQRVHLQTKQSQYDSDLWLQISELPPIDGKQYVLAYAIWPQDVPKPQSLEHYQAHLLNNLVHQP